jgi:circadian clock protein KaiC
MSETPVRPDEITLEKVPTGIEGLDAILKGGFLQGGITIIQGKPGVGKTILGNQLCFNHAARGGRALYVTLLAETHSRMLLHIGKLGFFNSSAIPDHVFYLSGFPVLETEGVRGLLTLLRHEVRTHDATLLVLDGLIAAETAAGSDMEFKKFIHELQTQATMANCIMFLLSSGGDDPDLTTAEHTMVDGVIQMRSRLYGWKAERDLEILKRRGDGFLHGRHAFRISDAGITVFPRFEALFATPTRTERDDNSRASTGLAQLDTMLDGGIPRGSSTLLVGPSGSGKTSFGLHFLSQCSPEEPGLFFGFYEAPAGVRAKAAALGLAVSGLIDNGDVALSWQPTTEALLDETCARLLESVRVRRVHRLFLDGLGGFAKLAGETDRVGHILTALVNELRALGVTSVFTKETDDPLGGVVGFPSLGGSPITVSEVADNLVLFQFVKLRSRLYRTVLVLKMRDSRIDDRLRLFEMTSSGILVDDAPDRAEAILAEALGQAGGSAPLHPDATARDPSPQGP